MQMLANLFKMNPFLFVNTILTLGAAIWFFATGGVKTGMLNLCFTASNIVFLWIGKQ